ncbi:MAG: hypothetical protein V3W43_09235 [Desulfatiglandaceae bacterium]
MAKKIQPGFVGCKIVRGAMEKLGRIGSANWSCGSKTVDAPV